MRSITVLLPLLLLTVFAYSQDFALQQLEDSPRHHEWVELTSGERTLHCFVAYPEVSTKALTVIVIHENRGLTDWVRSLADQLAAEGYIAIAPDLLSDFNEEYDRTSTFPSSDAARNAIYELDADQVTHDLEVAQDYVTQLPAANGQNAVMGFCWGGSQTFRFATNNDEIKAAMVFYGTAPKEPEPFLQIEAPVYGFYGGNDQRVNATLEGTRRMMTAAGKSYEIAVYDGAGHAYMRRGDDPNADQPNRMARNQSWERILEILKNLD